jgi:hypothetical protein
MNKDQSPLIHHSNTPLLHLLRRVPPGECGLASSDGDPGTNGVITKLAAEQGIKAKSVILQADIW